MNRDEILQSVLENISTTAEIRGAAFVRLECLVGRHLAQAGMMPQATAVFESSMTRNLLTGSGRGMCWALAEGQDAGALGAQMTQMYWRHALGLLANSKNCRAGAVGQLARVAVAAGIPPSDLDVVWRAEPEGWPRVLRHLHAALMVWAAPTSLVKKCDELLEQYGVAPVIGTRDAADDALDRRVHAVLVAGRHADERQLVQHLRGKHRDQVGWRAIGALLSERRYRGADLVSNHCSALVRARMCLVIAAIGNPGDAVSRIRMALDIAPHIVGCDLRAETFTRAFTLLSDWGVDDIAADAKLQAVVALWLSPAGDRADCARCQMVLALARFGGDIAEMRQLANSISPGSWVWFERAWTAIARCTAKRSGIDRALEDASNDPPLPQMVQRLALATTTPPRRS